ncbi:MAG: SBBP repeat-containing protein [Anaerolineae bacterium]|nr:SBBP repeat-containing protein [Anaerolineae bacterium]
MNRWLFLVLIGCLLLVSPTMAQGEGSSVRQEAFYSDVLGREMQYTVYLPAGYEATEMRYPVLYLLHGRGDSMEAWLTVRGVFDDLIAAGDLPPFIAIMPDAPSLERAGYYVDSEFTAGEAFEMAFMQELIPHVDATYRTLTARESRVVGGYSMGGYGALRYALAYPELFVGALVLSPAVYTPLPPADSSTREFGAFGRGDRLFDPDRYAALNYPALLESFAPPGLLHLFIAVGDDEWKNPDPADALHDLDMEAHLLFNRVSRAGGIAAEFRVYDGGHDWDVWQRGFIEGMTVLVNHMLVTDEPVASDEPLDGILTGTPGVDLAGGVAVDADGSVYRALAASGPVDGQAHAGDLDVVLTRYAPDGSVLWTRQVGTPAADRPYGVALDAQGSVYVTGYTSGDLDGQHPGNAGNDAFLIRFTPEGDIEWIAQFGTADEADRGYGLAIGPDGVIYVAGYSKGDLAGANAGDKDIYLARFSPDGTLEWVQQFGGSGEDKAQGVVVDDSGQVIVVGMMSSDLAGSAGGIDAFAAAYDVQGQQLWLRQFGTAEWDEATGVAAAPDGRLYVTGFSAADFAGALAGDKDIIVVALGPDGEQLQAVQVGTPLNDKGADIRVDVQGNIIVAAFSNGNLAGSLGRFDVVLLGFAPDLTPLWVRQFGTPEDDGADEWAEQNLFLAVGQDTLIVTGLTLGGTRNQPPAGDGDVFLLRLQPPPVS